MVSTSHLWLLKFKWISIKSWVLQLHWSHVKCSVDTDEGLPYWTVQIQNISIIEKVLLNKESGTSDIRFGLPSDHGNLREAVWLKSARTCLSGKRSIWLFKAKVGKDQHRKPGFWWQCVISHHLDGRLQDEAGCLLSRTWLSLRQEIQDPLDPALLRFWPRLGKVKRIKIAQVAFLAQILSVSDYRNLIWSSQVLTTCNWFTIRYSLQSQLSSSRIIWRGWIWSEDMSEFSVSFTVWKLYLTALTHFLLECEIKIETHGFRASAKGLSRLSLALLRR